MLKQGTLLSELQSIVGKKHAHEPKNEHDCLVDGLSPRAIVQPGSYEEVADILRFADTERLAVIPRGAGSQMWLGNVPSRYDIALTLTRLDQIIEHEPADMTVTCQAGISSNRLRERLDAAGQYVPVCNSRTESIGGLLASNRIPTYHYGSSRDYTLGMRVVTTDGRVTRAGGRVVKNVAGYDLCKLYIGSRGTLGVIVEATLKTVPKPPSRDDFCLEFSSLSAACEFTRKVVGLGLSVGYAPMNRYGGPATPVPSRRTVVQLSFRGTKAAVDRSGSAATALSAQYGGRRGDEHELLDGEWYDAAAGGSSGPALDCMFSVLPRKLAPFIEAIEQVQAPAQMLTSPVAGWASAFWPGHGHDEHLLAEARRVALAFDASCTVQLCSPELKRQIDVFGPTPPSFPLMRAIKH
ncbi:MAG TPA: FAD-binding oxidoreductase, partial [Dehalococcoidia bacterium]|nr:FAD-binding oxidoreductase [Dehalococcoidia bacterium]